MNKKDAIRKRAKEEAKYFIANHSTIRATAEKFEVSKSTVHKDLRERLPLISSILALQVSEILETNLDERSIRGGRATQKKYLELRNHPS